MARKGIRVNAKDYFIDSVWYCFLSLHLIYDLVPGHVGRSSVHIKMAIQIH